MIKLKKIAPAIILIVLIVTGGILLSMDGKDAVAVHAEKRDSLLAAEQFNVSFQQVGGRITDVLVENGQFVEQGSALLELDTSDIDLQIERLEVQIATMDYQIAQAQASVVNYDVNAQKKAVQTAQSSLENAQNSYNRTESLYNEGAVAETSLETARHTLTAAENALAQNQETLNKLQNNVGVSGMNVPILDGQRKGLEIQMVQLLDQKNRMTLKSPVSGTILRVVPKPGENVAAGSPVVILQSKQLYFDIYIPETKVSSYSTGDTVPVNIIATNEKMSATVQYVISAPPYASNRMTRDNSQGDLASFQIRLALEGDIDHLLPGMTVEVNFNETI